MIVRCIDGSKNKLLKTGLTYRVLGEGKDYYKLEVYTDYGTVYGLFYKDLFVKVDDIVGPSGPKGSPKGPIKFDNIHKPRHYNLGIETIDYINSWNMGYIEGNIIKYVTRYPYKNGLEDLEKAKEYLERLIKLVKKDV